jgi:hypothetical protein
MNRARIGIVGILFGMSGTAALHATEPSGSKG